MAAPPNPVHYRVTRRNWRVRVARSSHVDVENGYGTTLGGVASIDERLLQQMPQAQALDLTQSVVESLIDSVQAARHALTSGEYDDLVDLIQQLVDDHAGNPDAQNDWGEILRKLKAQQATATP